MQVSCQRVVNWSGTLSVVHWGWITHLLQMDQPQLHNRASKPLQSTLVNCIVLMCVRLQAHGVRGRWRHMGSCRIRVVRRTLLSNSSF